MVRPGCYHLHLTIVFRPIALLLQPIKGTKYDPMNPINHYKNKAQQRNNKQEINMHERQT